MRAIRVVACLAGMGALLALVPILDRSRSATYGGADPRLLGLEVGAAIALLLISAVGQAGVATLLLAVVGAAWLGPELAGADGVSLPARTLADAIGPLLAVALLIALVLRSGAACARARLAVLIAGVGAAVAVGARVFLVDPFDQVACWRTCEHNPLRVTEASLGEPVETIGLLGLAVGVCWSAVILLPGPFRGAERWTGNRSDLVGWFALGAVVASLLAPPTVSVSRDDVAVGAFVVVQVAVVGWLGALGLESWARWRLESRLAHLVDLLGGSSDPEVLTSSLRGAVRDPGVRLAYWAGSRQAYVDGAGRPTSVADVGPGQMVTVVVREGHTVAAIVHSRRVGAARLERALGPALRLALENAQLRAASLAELSELTDSRTRVVERAALERWRLERNLHDGAQQRAVSLALLVRVFCAGASPVDEEAGRRAAALTRTLIEELRRVARGIYPAILADAGLAGALLDLAERSQDLPVVANELPDGRFPGAVETTAFLVVRAGLADSRSRGARSASVAARQVDGVLLIRVEDDAADDTSPRPFATAPELSDQVSALGGTVRVASAPGRRCAEVVLPCGS